MAQKKAHEVDRWLEATAGDVPMVVIYGPDHGMVAERGLRYARATGLPLDDPFCVFKAEAADLEQDAGQLQTEILTIPMFAERKLVWVRGLTSQKRVIDALLSALVESAPSVSLLVEAGDLKKNHALRAGAERAASAMCLPCYADDAAALDTLIDGELQTYGLTITLDARRLLKPSLGGDRLASRGEIAKLCLYCLERGRIDVEDISNLVGDVAEASGEGVVDAVLQGNLPALEQQFTRLEMAGNVAFPVLSALLRQFNQLLALRGDMEAGGKSASAAVAGARPPVFFKRRSTVEGALGRWDAALLGRHLERLHGAVLETRRRPQLATALARHLALSLAVEASRRR